MVATPPGGMGQASAYGKPYVMNTWNDGASYGGTTAYIDDAGSERSTMLNERVQRLQGKI